MEIYFLFDYDFSGFGNEFFSESLSREPSLLLFKKQAFGNVEFK
jgi:hypothetical protein